MANLKFDFCDTEIQAIDLVKKINNSQSAYMRKHHPAYYTPWSNADGSDKKFVVWHRN